MVVNNEVCAAMEASPPECHASAALPTAGKDWCCSGVAFPTPAQETRVDGPGWTHLPVKNFVSADPPIRLVYRRADKDLHCLQ